MNDPLIIFFVLSVGLHASVFVADPAATPPRHDLSRASMSVAVRLERPATLAAAEADTPPHRPLAPIDKPLPSRPGSISIPPTPAPPAEDSSAAVRAFESKSAPHASRPPTVIVTDPPAPPQLGNPPLPPLPRLPPPPAPAPSPRPTPPSAPRPGVETTTPPLPLPKNREPTYPRRAFQRGQEGTVELEFEVLTTGLVGAVEVRQSSGHAMLNDAAVKAVQSWEFQPATRNDRPVRFLIRQPFRFDIQSRR
ncbi:MAG: TonB family protein [Phycisphaerae bacterium]|nr:TonB family protein [Phycisphaerae bacterium]